MLDDETTEDVDKADKDGDVDTTTCYNPWLEMIKEAEKAAGVGDADTLCMPCLDSLGIFGYQLGSSNDCVEHKF